MKHILANAAKEIIAVCCENHTKPMNTLWAKCSSSLKMRRRCRLHIVSYHWLKTICYFLQFLYEKRYFKLS
jgi:hypothetical protein